MFRKQQHIYGRPIDMYYTHNGRRHNLLCVYIAPERALLFPESHSTSKGPPPPPPPPICRLLDYHRHHHSSVGANQSSPTLCVWPLLKKWWGRPNNKKGKKDDWKKIKDDRRTLRIINWKRKEYRTTKLFVFTVKKIIQLTDPPQMLLLYVQTLSR